jgi:hypothetical protein
VRGVRTQSRRECGYFAGNNRRAESRAPHALQPMRRKTDRQPTRVAHRSTMAPARLTIFTAMSLRIVSTKPKLPHARAATLYRRRSRALLSPFRWNRRIDQQHLHPALALHAARSQRARLQIYCAEEGAAADEPAERTVRRSRRPRPIQSENEACSFDVLAKKNP